MAESSMAVSSKQRKTLQFVMTPTSANLPPNPCLVAILLIIRTKAGPRLVFHYPLTPSATSASAGLDPAWYGNPSTVPEESDEFSSDWSSETEGARTGEDDATEGSRGRDSKRDTVGSLRSGRSKATQLAANDDLEEDFFEDSRGRHGDGRHSGTSAEGSQHEEDYGGDEVLGFGADGLSAMLSPGRAFDKKKFEVGIDQWVFVGAPRYVREDGLWRKRKKERQKTTRKGKGKVTDTGKQAAGSNHNDHHEDEGVEMALDERELDKVTGFDPAYGHGLMPGAASAAGSDAGSDAKSTSTNGSDSEMTMFNIVFVLNPPAQEYHVRVSDMYENVVKKFAKALKYEQANKNYVYKESKLILSMKDKAREQRTPSFNLWPKIIRNSALAKSIVITFDAISTNKIAHINLSMGFDTSFQIPQALSTPCIPTSSDPQMPGLWLTTATLVDDEDSETTLSPHSALLLLEDQDTLLKEVESDAKELSGPLSYLIRNLTPTKSLLKLSQTHSMALKDLQILARHLIYWRRARAIPPLRPIDTYIVSPNADMRALPTAIPAFAARFPTLPPLPKILQSLSGTPKPYGLLMPSKDHARAYMEILAWLMRGGWVTQLRTFGWVVVTPEVKAAVAEKMYEEAQHAAQRGKGDRETTDPIDSLAESTSRLLSPSNTGDVLRSPDRKLSSSDAAPKSVLAGNPVDPAPTLTAPKFHPSNYTSSIVHSPQKANELESRWIERIGASFSDDPELTELWPRLLKYFDGRHALEVVPVREGLKKKRVGAVLAKLVAAGWVMTVRHW